MKKLLMVFVITWSCSTPENAPVPSVSAPPTTTSTVAPSPSTSVATTTTVAATPPSVTGVPRSVGDSQVARASWYAYGSLTASGEAFNPDGMTFAHLTMGFGTVVRFCYQGACVEARCTDRGPAAWTGKTFDLSRGAFQALAPLGTGVINVRWEVVG